MADIQRAIAWWDVWQLRILVLGSLGLQWFLLVSAPMRKYTIPSWFRRCIWLAYISCDALAIYALATLFNRHARASSAYNNDTAALEVLWAPLLLVHLGGRDEITAFSIHDNELWTRHTVTVVSQVTVALYAFYKSWPPAADRRLLHAAIMLFFCGVINFCEKPWALRSASINRLVAMSSIVRGKRRELHRCEQLFTDLPSKYYKRLLLCWTSRPSRDEEGQQEDIHLSVTDQVQVILSDISPLALAALGDDDDEEASKRRGRLVLATLSPGAIPTIQLKKAFELIYTRANVVSAPAYLIFDYLLVPTLYIAAIMLFAMGEKQEYSTTDVKMTYIFMAFTAVLDTLGVFIGLAMYKLMSLLRVPALCMTLRRYSLVDSATRRMKPRTGALLKCFTYLGYQDYSSGGSGCCYCCSQQGNRPRLSSGEVVTFVVFTLLKPRNIEKLDLATYRRLDTHNWVLVSDLQDEVSGHPTIRRTLCDSPFDESVLLWHVATDLCFCESRSRVSDELDELDELREESTKAISNYMCYLLKFQPEMLMTGSRPHLFTQAMEELEKLFLLDSAKKLSDIMLHSIDKKDYPLIHDACKLAEELKELDLGKRLRLMFGVWMGMLCYSASMCRGYLHAKSLGEGGEFLTLIWIIISLKGGKTLADKLQMSEKDEAPQNNIVHLEATPSSEIDITTT